MKVTLLIGANAYACIDNDGRKTDIRLSPGKRAWASLRESADEYRIGAEYRLGMARLCDEAADILEREKRPTPPKPSLPDMVAANIAPLDTIAPEPEPVTLFPMTEPTVEAVMCLWEAVLELKEVAVSRYPDVEDAAASLRRLFEDHGTNVMRHAVMRLAPDCCREWGALDDDAQAQAAPFDWEFVPAFLRRQITSGNLLLAVMAQY